MAKLSEVREALVTVALIIERDGPVYLPLYLRLEEEEKKLVQHEAGMKRALRQAKQYWQTAGQGEQDCESTKPS